MEHLIEFIRCVPQKVCSYLQLEYSAHLSGTWQKRLIRILYNYQIDVGRFVDFARDHRAKEKNQLWIFFLNEYAEIAFQFLL